jgi:hypothetical protein
MRNVTDEKNPENDKNKATSLFLLSCDGLFPSQSKPDVPPDHTQKISGFLHKPGLFDPLDERNGCMTASCHGDDLTGGTAISSGRHIAVSSCYECHGAVWEGGEESEREGHDD